jgi:hypothetical protein
MVHAPWSKAAREPAYSRVRASGAISMRKPGHAHAGPWQRAAGPWGSVAPAREDGRGERRGRARSLRSGPRGEPGSDLRVGGAVVER